MLAVLKRMGYLDITVHGFRSTFRDWAAECTDFPSEVVEMALAHTISNKVEAAYRRRDLFDKRTRLFEGWSMGLIENNSITKGILLKYCGVDRPDVDTMTLADVTEMMRTMLGRASSAKRSN